MGRKKTRYSELNIKIGQRIKDERLKLGLSCQKIADRLGFESGNSVLYWERGTAVPVDVISKLADVFHVRVEYLICKDDHREVWHDVMNPEESNAWLKFTQEKLNATLIELENCRLLLRKNQKETEITSVIDGSSIGLLDGVKLSKQELQALKIIIEGIRSNRKEVDNS